MPQCCLHDDSAKVLIRLACGADPADAWMREA
jgi:hypothetical protein